MKKLIRLSAGLSQVEIMVAILVISIVIIGVITAFSTMGKGLITSKTRTIANNLAQEKIESLKNFSYARLLVTPEGYEYFPSGADYTEYEPETLSIGDASYTRYTTIWKAREVTTGSTMVISTMSPSATDEGIKKIKIEIKWMEGSEQKSLTLYNFRDDPNRSALSGKVYGLVITTWPATPPIPSDGISGAQVEIVQDINKNATSSTTGYYLIKTTSPATVQVRASKDGYWSTTSAGFSVGTNPQNLQLQQKLTGTVTGWVVITDHILISLVVSATDYSGFEQEYVQLYNPTTWAWTINDTTIDLYYVNSADTVSEIPLSYFRTASIPSYGYYLIANSTVVYIGSGYVVADSTWTGNIIANALQSGICLTNDYRVWIDSVAWGKTSGLGADPPPAAEEMEGFRYNDGGNSPIVAGKQLYRWHYTDSSYGLTGTIRGGGPYDSNYNNMDFTYDSIPNAPPFNTDSTYTPACGTPAAGAVVSANDGLSSSTTAYLKTSAGGKSNAYFSISVATGTCTVYISSGNYFREIANVSVNYGVGTAIPNSSTSPQWPATNRNEVILSSPSVGGFISGYVKRSDGTGVSGIMVSAGIYSIPNTDSNGYYSFSVDAGSYTVIANPNYNSASWTSGTDDSAASKSVEVVKGGAVLVDNLVIYPAGYISGTTKNMSGDALPYITVRSTSTAAAFSKDVISGTNGTYLMKGVKIATDYDLYPVLDEADSYTKDGGWTTPVTVSQGLETTSKNFKITSAWGKITGTVSDTAIGGNIKTGVLIIATTAAMPNDSPPTISGGNVGGTSTIYYGTISNSSGNYSVSVRRGWTYNLKSWYTKVSGDTVAVQPTKTGTVNFGVNDSSATVSFAWP